MAFGEETAEVLRTALAARLPDPISSLAFLVAVGKSTVDDLSEIADSQPNALVVGLLDSKLYLVLEGIQRRFDDSNVIAI